ncbi:hypothetical protein ABBQ38_002517 [Trebouxia sp. C0009 RCD-2024]
MAAGKLLENKVCVITGGGRGIGAAIAERFAAEGAILILTARSKDQLQQVAQSCTAKGAAGCDVLPVDLSQAGEVEQFAKDVLGKHKQVDVLVNNAGMGAPGKNSPLSNPGDFAHWQKLLMTNTLAPMILTNLFALGMAERRSGLIINIASVASLSAMPETAVYATSKWGLRGWSLSCYEVLRHHDVKVVLINPGPVATPMTEGRMDPTKASPPEDVAQIAMMALTLSPQSVPVEMTLNTTEPADPSQ